MLTRTVSAPMTPEDLDALRRLARAEDRSVSSIIRLSIRAYIQNSEAAPVKSGSAKTRMTVRDDQE